MSEVINIVLEAGAVFLLVAAGALSVWIINYTFGEGMRTATTAQMEQAERTALKTAKSIGLVAAILCVAVRVWGAA